MKFALVDNIRVVAFESAKGICEICGSEVIAKCGPERVNHWAHKNNRDCDKWWESESAWHQSWKDEFPVDWQEVVHVSESGERHRADVKTEELWVIEFQHSVIKPSERDSRNNFYGKLVWVVDGTKRQRDKPKFYTILDEFRIKSIDPRFIRIIGPDDCKLIKDWHDSNALVFFDFQDTDATGQSILWFLFPQISYNEAYLWPIPRVEFIRLHIENKFDQLIEKIISPFIERIIQEEKIEVESQRARMRRKQLAHSNWIRFGRPYRR